METENLFGGPRRGLQKSFKWSKLMLVGTLRYESEAAKLSSHPWGFSFTVITV